jgi:hypothetical protein
MDQKIAIVEDGVTLCQGRKTAPMVALRDTASKGDMVIRILAG